MMETYQYVNNTYLGAYFLLIGVHLSLVERGDGQADRQAGTVRSEYAG